MTDKRPPPYPLRMSEALKHCLQSASDEFGRSLNAEILLRLRASLTPTELEKFLSDEGNSRLEGYKTLKSLYREMPQNEFGETIKVGSIEINSEDQLKRLIIKIIKSESFKLEDKLIEKLNRESRNDQKALQKSDK